ncbi:MAG: enoyl-CoA hydratase/isomerase family protein, partial [Acidobacteria bacterium]|nr:enoyl-CoA hydratase/isomerase family protein [Acidobacteriota bacterium]
MSVQPIRTVEGDGFVHLILDHGVNALDDELLAALGAALEELGRAGAPPLILESSHPRIFSPGWDLKALYGAPSETVQRVLERFSQVVTDLFAYPGPTAAAIG